MSIGFGIVGTGSIARHQARALAEVEGAAAVAVLSRDPERAAAFAEEFELEPYVDLTAFLAASSLEAVSVCSPSGAHLEYIEAAATAGKHVIVEKPIEITAERCDRIVGIAETSGVAVAGIFQSRYYHNAREVKQAIEQGRFGRLTMGDAYVKFYRTQDYYDSGGWKGTVALDGGGALMNQGIHAVDLLLWLMGPVRRVHGTTKILGHERIEVEDTAVATLEFENGALGVIEGATTTYPGLLKRVEISGTTGTAVLEEEDLRTWQFAEETPQDDEIRRRLSTTTTSGGGASDPMAIDTTAHARELEDFVDAIQSGRAPEVDAREARKAVDLILAVYESARTGGTVELAG
jgi:predicted dehydrogenase